MSRIPHAFRKLEAQETHEGVGELDFEETDELNGWVTRFLSEFECPGCGSRQLKLSGCDMIVEYRAVHVVRRSTQKGWFGGLKEKNAEFKTVWRIHDMYLKTTWLAAALGFVGVCFDEVDAVLGPAKPPRKPKVLLKCKVRGCNWTHTHGAIRWMSAARSYRKQHGGQAVAQHVTTTQERDIRMPVVAGQDVVSPLGSECFRCSLSGFIIPHADSRRLGYGCRLHTELSENGGKQTAERLLNYYPDQRDEFPHGRYCCSFCRAQREPL